MSIDKKRLPPTPSTPVAIKEWFDGKGTSQSVKLTDADRAMFLKLEGLYPGHKVANFRDLVRLLGKAAFEGSGATISENDIIELGQLRAQVAQLTKEVRELTATNIMLKSKNQQLATENERLSTENEQLTEERNQAIQRSMEIYNAPFAQLDEESFRTVIDITDNKIMPLLRQLTDTPFLELTPRQKFLLIWNYAVNDPIQHIFKHMPGIPDDAKQKLEDLQFPRAVDMEAIYGEFTATVKHILAKVEAAEKQQIPLEKVLDAFEAKIYNGYTAYYNNQPATNDTTQLIQEETEDTGHHGEGAE